MFKELIISFAESISVCPFVGEITPRSIFIFYLADKDLSSAGSANGFSTLGLLSILFRFVYAASSIATSSIDDPSSSSPEVAKPCTKVTICWICCVGLSTISGVGVRKFIVTLADAVV